MSEELAEFGRWLDNEIDKRDWKQADFARVGGFKPQNVSRWIGGTVQPSYQSARAIALVLRVNEDEVLIRTGHRTAPASAATPTPQPLMPVAIPVYDSPISAGKGVAALQQYIYLPPDIDIRSDWYGLPVHGDCMFPLLLSGDTVIISPRATAEPGDMVVVDMDEEKGLVKWLREKQGVLWLVPEKGEAILFDEEHIRIVGVVMRMWRNVRRPRKGMWSE